MTKGESAFGFKAYGGGQGLQKWDKGMQTILEANAHPAALAIYEGNLKSPTNNGRRSEGLCEEYLGKPSHNY